MKYPDNLYFGIRELAIENYVTAVWKFSISEFDEIAFRSSVGAIG
jgi:hypothetical protein